MTFWCGFEFGRVERRAVGTHAATVRHVRDQPHAGARKTVGRGELPPGSGCIRRAATGDKLVHHLAHPYLSKRIVANYAIAGSPVRKLGVGPSMSSCQFYDALAFGGCQLIGGTTGEMLVYVSSQETDEEVISAEAAAARSDPTEIALDGWAIVSVLAMCLSPASCRRS